MSDSYLGAAGGGRPGAPLDRRLWAYSDQRPLQLTPRTLVLGSWRVIRRQAVAGVRLVDSEIARLATEVSRKQSPPYLFNHAVRTFLFGSLMGRATGQKFDEEVLYLACILHDLGLTERFEGDLPSSFSTLMQRKR